VGQKQKERKNKKLALKTEVIKQVRERKVQKYSLMRKIAFGVIIAIVSFGVIGGGAWAIARNTGWIKDKFNPKPAKIEYGVIETDKGKIVFELYTKDAPKTTENFKLLTDKKYFDSLKFHRVVKDFVIQGGDPKGDGTGGESAWGGQFEDEINPKSLGLSKDVISENEKAGYKYNYKLNSHKMVLGSVAMANSGPNTNGSQFFIVTTQDQPTLDGKYSVFGQVVEGLDVANKIVQDDKMNKVYVIEKEEYDLSKVK